MNSFGKLCNTLKGSRMVCSSFMGKVLRDLRMLMLCEFISLKGGGS